MIGASWYNFGKPCSLLNQMHFSFCRLLDSMQPLSLTQSVHQLFLALRANWKTIVIVALVCFGVLNLLDLLDTRESRAQLATGLLCFNYLGLVMLIAAHLLRNDQAHNGRISTWFGSIVNAVNGYRMTISLVLAFNLLIIFQETHHIRLINNLTIGFSYALLLYHIIAFGQKKLRAAEHQLNLSNQKGYIVYAVFIFICFTFAKDFDDRDPFGTQFQYYVFCWLMVVHLVVSWFVGVWSLVKRLKNERVQSELMHLKSQINPHFFFNTLNNLYGLALEKSDATPGLILQLSDMMRYTIYQGQQDSVPLQQEIDYLNNFIELQKIRFQKQVEVDFDIQIEQPVKVPPLLFINLVENAYKHGVETLADNAFVTMSLLVTDGQLTFTVRNNFDPDAANVNSGIGLSNLAKRLELQYPNKHQLNIDKQTNCFTVTLELNLS